MGREFTTILPDSKPLTKDAVDKFIADLGLKFSSGAHAKSPFAAEESSNYTKTRDKEDLQAKQKALQDLQADPNTSKDPELKKEIMKRKAALDKDANEMADIMRLAGMEESATAGATSAGNIASVEAPHLSPGNARGKKIIYR
jgi:hypothetical protein